MQAVKSAADFQAHYGVSRETLGRLQAYTDTLIAWQRAINLIAPSTVDDVWNRHFSDSAQLVRAVDASAVKTWVDLGSGAGFPGLVVAALLAETGRGTRVILVESDAKKCAFLREATRKMAFGDAVLVDIRCERIENCRVSSKVGSADVVSARALADLKTLFALSEGFWGAETTGVFPKGQNAATEIREAQKEWSFDLRLLDSVTDAAARIVVIRNLVRLTAA